MGYKSSPEKPGLMGPCFTDTGQAAGVPRTGGWDAVGMSWVPGSAPSRHWKDHGQMRQGSLLLPD